MSESIFAERTVQNLLDTDFYKLTMMQAVLHNYPNAEVEWEFRCRSSEDLTPYLAEIRYQIERLSELSLSVDQLAFLDSIPFIKPDFIRFLSLFRFNLRYVHTSIEDGQLNIRLREYLAARDPLRSTAAGHRQRSAQPLSLPRSAARTGRRAPVREARLAQGRSLAERTGRLPAG